MNKIKNVRAPPRDDPIPSTSGASRFGFRRAAGTAASPAAQRKSLPPPIVSRTFAASGGDGPWCTSPLKAAAGSRPLREHTLILKVRPPEDLLLITGPFPLSSCAPEEKYRLRETERFPRASFSPAEFPAGNVEALLEAGDMDNADETTETVIVVVKCSDGVVLAADSKQKIGDTGESQEVEKLQCLNKAVGTVWYTTTGHGHLRLLLDQLKAKEPDVAGSANPMDVMGAVQAKCQKLGCWKGTFNRKNGHLLFDYRWRCHGVLLPLASRAVYSAGWCRGRPDGGKGRRWWHCL